MQFQMNSRRKPWNWRMLRQSFLLLSLTQCERNQSTFAFISPAPIPDVTRWKSLWMKSNFIHRRNWYFHHLLPAAERNQGGKKGIDSTGLAFASLCRLPQIMPNWKRLSNRTQRKIFGFFETHNSTLNNFPEWISPISVASGMQTFLFRRFAEPNYALSLSAPWTVGAVQVGIIVESIVDAESRWSGSRHFISVTEFIAVSCLRSHNIYCNRIKQVSAMYRCTQCLPGRRNK